MEQIEIYLSEHSPAVIEGTKGHSFWAMVEAKTENVSSLEEQEIKSAIARVFRNQAPVATKIPKGIYFTVSYNGKRIFHGHLEADGFMNVFWSDSGSIP